MKLSAVFVALNKMITTRFTESAEDLQIAFEQIILQRKINN